MVINKRGYKFETDDNVFMIGASVKANDTTEYKDQIGRILEIRTGDDKDTNNEGADIYVDYGVGEVIMAVEMLETL